MSDSSMDRNSIEVLAEEFVTRYRNGERPPLSEYTQQYPQLANEIIDLFPAMLLMENLKPSDHSQESPLQQDASTIVAPPFAQLGDYRIIREVGRGGMGVVYEAEQVTLGRRVALKLLPKEMHSNSKHRLRFEREARAAAKLHHTNIVPVFGVGFEEQQCYYVMQFIQGQALDKILEELHRMNARPGTTAAAKVQTTNQPAGPLQNAVQASPNEPRTIDSQIAAGLVAQMLLTGVFHESDSESAEQPSDEAGDSFGATIVPGKSKDLRGNDPQNEPPQEPKGSPEQSKRLKAARQHGLSAKSTDSLKLSNSSITLSGRSGERPTKATREATYWESVAKIGLQVAGALEYAHSQGVLHRDIKPANLVLDMKGTVWVTDFGLARLQDERDLTRTGDILGTLRYMAPEVFKGQNDVRSELYALGLTLYELLALRPAFDGNSRNVLIDQVMTAEIEPLGRINPEIPSDLQTLIHKAISRDPQDRYQTAGELADDLQRFIDDEPIRARRVSTIERMKRWSRHNRGLSRALATVVALLFVINVAGPILTLRMVKLNSELKQSEGKLSTTVVKLTSTAEELTKARNEAVRQAEQAEAARQESLTMLADMQTERGLLAGREGQLATASLWFANAAAITPHDYSRQIANLRRAENWSVEAMTPVSLLKPGHDAQRMEFQSGGPLLMTLQPNGLRVWDWRNEVALRWSEQMPLAVDAAMSPDGKLIAALFNKGEVTLLDPSSGNVLRNFHSADGMSSVDWSPDGLRLAVAGRHLQIWNVSSEPRLESDWSHPAKITGVRFSRSGKRIVSCSEDNWARVFAISEPNSPAPLFPPMDHRQGIKRRETTPVFCDSDRRIVTLGSATHMPVLHDATMGTILPVEWKIHGEMDRSLDVSPDGRWISAGGSRDVILLSADGHKSLLLPHSNHVHLAMFAPDNRSLATLGYEAIVRLFPLRDLSNLDAGTPEIIPQHGTFANGVFSPDSHALAVSSNQQIVIWERKSAAPVTGRIPWNHAAVRPRPGFDGQFVTPGIFHEFYGAYQPHQTDLTVCRSNDGTQASPNIKIKGLLLDSCICADNTSVAAVTIEQANGWVALFDVVTGTPKWTPLTLPALPVSVAARPGHSEIAVLLETGRLLIIDTTSGQVKQVHDHPGTEAVPDASTARVAYSPDGTTIVSVLRNHEISIRDARTGELRCPLFNPMIEWGVIRSIAFSPDSRMLATAVTGKNMAQVWSLSTGEKVGVGMSHPGDYFGLWSLRFSPDGKQLATSHKDGRVRIFDWQSGKIIGSPLQHADEVNDIAYTSDGRHLLASVRNGRLHVWDVATGKLAMPLSVSHRPDGGGAVCLTESHVVVLDSIGHSVLDLSTLLPPVESDVSSQLLRAELASNQKLQVGELVPLESHEWSTRWERLVAARQSPEQVAESLARSLDAASDFQSQSLIIARAARRGLLEQLRILRPKSLPCLIALTLQRSRRSAGQTPGLQSPENTHRDASATEQLRGEVLVRLQEISAQGPVDPGLMAAVSQLLIEDTMTEHFRLEVSEEPSARLAGELIIAVRQNELQPLESLVAACLINGESSAAMSLLQSAPPATSHTRLVRGLLHAVTLQQLGDHDMAKQVVKDMLADIVWEPLPRSMTGFVNSALQEFGGLTPSDVENLAVARVIERELARLTNLIDASPDDHRRFQSRAEYLARLGRWSEAAESYSQQLERTDTENWRMVMMRVATSHLFAGDYEAYRQMCEQGVNRFPTVNNIDEADVLTKICLLVPETIELSRLPVQMVQEAAHPSDQQHPVSWLTACSALVAYRRGQLEEARELSLQVTPGNWAAYYCLAQSVRALAAERLGNREEALQALANAELRIPQEISTLGKNPKEIALPTTALNIHHDWLIAELIRREAALLIHKDTARTTNSDPAQPDNTVLRSREDLLTMGQWGECAKLVSDELDRSPRSRVLMTDLAVFQLLAGDSDGYRATCRKALRRFSDDLSSDQADALCRICLLIPNAVESTVLPVAQLRAAIDDPAASERRDWRIAISALAAYRTSDFEMALSEIGKQASTEDHQSSITLLVKAMAEEKRGRNTEARSLLLEAETLIPWELRTLGTNSYTGLLPVPISIVETDWLVAEIIRREAAILIRGNDLDMATVRALEEVALRDRFAMQGRWTEAAEAAKTDFETAPQDRALFSYTAALLMLAGNSEDHQRFCESGLRRFLPTTNPDIADSICKSCLLTPDSIDSALLPVEALRNGIADPNLLPAWGWYHSSLALCLYRTGEYSEAISETEAIGQLQGHIGSLALVVRAMSEEKLGDHRRASETLAEAETHIPAELSSLGTSEHTGRSLVTHSDISVDWLIPEVLRREAAQLIRGDSMRLPGSVRELERLGQQFFQQSSPERALIALRRATELDPSSPTGHVWLGLTLNRLGFFEEAASVLTRAMELGDESALASQALAEAHRNQEILRRLPDLMNDRQMPKDAAEQQAIAEVCYYRSLFTQSMRFFLAALEAGQDLSHDESQVLRYNAACAAARASSGDGDGEQLSDQERLNLRQKAIDLLNAALGQIREQLADAQPAERSAVLSNLRTWLTDRDLESLRDAEALWKEHAALLE